MNNKIVHTSHQVIEKQLLVALSDKTKVALLFTEADIESLIQALRYAEQTRLSGVPQWKEMREGLQELRNAAFPPTKEGFSE